MATKTVAHKKTRRSQMQLFCQRISARKPLRLELGRKISGEISLDIWLLD